MLVSLFFSHNHVEVTPVFLLGDCSYGLVVVDIVGTLLIEEAIIF